MIDRAAPGNLQYKVPVDPAWFPAWERSQLHVAESSGAKDKYVGQL